MTSPRPESPAVGQSGPGASAEPGPAAGARGTARPASVSLEKVGKRFGRHRALANVSTSFAPGEVSVVLGPNGAGKSTMMAILATLSRPTSGRVQWGSTTLQPGVAARARIGYVGHDPGLYGDLSARQNLMLFARLFGLPPGNRVATIDTLLARVGLEHVLADRTDTPVKAFSRGMQQRLALARALLHEPELLLFDEPSSALDPAGAAWLAGQLGEQRDDGRIVVVITHDLDAAAAVTDHVVILRRGRIACDRHFDAPITGDDLRHLYQEQTRA